MKNIRNHKKQVGAAKADAPGWAGVSAETIESQFRSLVAASMDGFWLTDIQGHFLDVNEAYCQMIGYDRDELLTMSIAEVEAEENLEETAAHIRQLISAGSDRFESKHARKDGAIIDIEVSANYLDIQGGRFFVFLRDITARKRIEKQMDTLATAVKQSSDWILISDRAGVIEYVNDAVEQVTGYTREEILGQTPRILKSGKYDRAFYRKMWSTILTGRTYTGILTNRKKNGELFEVYHTITPIKDHDGNIAHFVATSKDITALKQMEERINFLAYYDDLTGLPNRALFMDRLRQAVARTEERDRYIGVLFIDIDRFHLVNDALGAKFGDVLLKETGKRLAAALREGDSVARFGSDEFVVALADLDSTEDLIFLIEGLKEKLSEPIRSAGEEIVLNFSLGVSVYPNDSRNGQVLLQNADMACQQARQAGGSCFRFFTAEMNRAASEFVLIEAKLKNAFKNKEFVLHYQPYWGTHSRKMVGMEALIRWQNPDGSLVPPGKFIHVLEETGMIIEVGDWVFETVVNQLKAWREQGYPVVPVSFNLSLIQFRSKDLVEKIRRTLQASGLDPALLTAEITESAFMEDIDYTRAVLVELREMGLSISIDDFGTGYSSLSCLKRLPVDNLKIDISFIRELGKDPDDEAVVSAIINMATTLNLKTIAEGVETEQQWQALRLLRCDTIQGFYFSRPLPAEELSELLKN
jgi:diguanylate cyclase (GGDEF)-like protein/PAS domain S-box-containing protein